MSAEPTQLFTLDEANATLPLVRAITQDLDQFITIGTAVLHVTSRHHSIELLVALEYLKGTLRQVLGDGADQR